MRTRDGLTNRGRWRSRIGWEAAALGALLAGSAVLFLWNLAASGWANAYYTAAVQAGARDWMAFLFGSFDASNAITVDKTPASLWVMDLSVRAFGFSAWSVLAPQAVEGVLAVWLLYATVKRRAGVAGGLLAGAVLALTPVAALMFRFNNPDALLTLLLTAAAYATVRAIDGASRKWLVAAGVAIGFAFLTKMLQGFLVIPAFAAAYLLAAPTTLRRRVLDVVAAGAAVVVSAGWWVALVMAWPADARPYIGGSQTNSVWELMLGYNGLGRLTGNEAGRVGGGGGPLGDAAGWLRLFQGGLGLHIAWLLPAALVALLGILVLTRHAPRTDRLRAQVIVWGGWLVVTGLVFSLMQGIFHAYYTVVLAPAIGAMLGLGVTAAWERRNALGVRLATSATLAGSAAWVTVLLARSPDWYPWLSPVVLTAGIGSGLALALAGSGLGARAAGQLRAGALAAGMAALLLAPGLGAVATASEIHAGAIPNIQPQVTLGTRDPIAAAGGFPEMAASAPAGWFPMGASGFVRAPGIAPFSGPAPNGSMAGGFMFAGRYGSGRRLGGLLTTKAADPSLIRLLQADASSYRWVAATIGANDAAGLALSSGEAVMAIGGFNGTDPSPTLAQFQADVAHGEIHYFVAGLNAAAFAAQGGSNVSARIADWVANHFTSRTVGGATVYDLTR